MEQSKSPNTLINTSSSDQFNYFDIPDLVLVSVKQEVKDEVIDEDCNSLEHIKTEENPWENLLKSEDHNFNSLLQGEIEVKNVYNVKTEAVENARENEYLLKEQNIKQENIEVEINIKESDTAEVKRGVEYTKSEESHIKRNGRKLFRIRNGLKLYINTNENILYKCGKCSYETTSWATIGQHHLRHKYIKDEDIRKCSHCEFKSLGKVLLNQHVLSQHGSEESKIFQCSYCNYKSVYFHNYKNHIKNRHTSIENVDIFKCNECSFQTKYKSCLQNHLMWHKGPDDVNWLKCPKCDYETFFKANLKAHLYTHKLKKKPKVYQCKLCEFKAQYKSKLRMHLQRHKLKLTVAEHKSEVSREL